MGVGVNFRAREVLDFSFGSDCGVDECAKFVYTDWLDLFAIQKESGRGRLLFGFIKLTDIGVNDVVGLAAGNIFFKLIKFEPELHGILLKGSRGFGAVGPSGLILED